MPTIDEICFILAIGLKPFYVGGTGRMQYADFLYMAALGLVLVLRCGMRLVIPKKAVNWLIAFVALLIYQVIISLIWHFILRRSGIQSNLPRYLRYYIFNFLVVICCFAFYQAYGFDRLRRLFIYGIIVASTVSLLGIFINVRASARSTGFFHNPNQLGYFSTLLITAAILFKKHITPFKRYFIIIAALVGVVSSISKAALLASAFLLVVSTIFGSESKADRNKIIRSVILLVVVFALIYLVMYGEYDFLTQNKTISVMRKKLANMSNENDTSLDSGRGYSRVGEIGINVLWGVGEGAFTRFNALSGVEVHSTYVNMIVSYGLIGFLGYAYIWLKPLLYGKRGLANLMLFSGILLYGVTHNGIRNTVLWTIIALIFLEKIDAEKRMEAPHGNALYGYSSAEY